MTREAGELYPSTQGRIGDFLDKIDLLAENMDRGIADFEAYHDKRAPHAAVTIYHPNARELGATVKELLEYLAMATQQRPQYS